MNGQALVGSQELTRAEVEQRLLSKALQDETWRETLLRDPQAIWQQEFGNTSLRDLQLSVLTETTDSLYLVLPAQDEVFRKELAQHPQAVWRREFGTAQLEGYTIRVVEEPAGQFYFVLPIADRLPALLQTLTAESDLDAAHPTQPRQNAFSQMQQQYRAITYRKPPKTKFGRICFYAQNWVIMTVLSHPIVSVALRPFYVANNWINAWRRL